MEQLYCRRCQRKVRVERPAAAWKWLRRLWIVVVILMIPISPIIVAEISVLTPMAVLFLFAGPLLHERAKEPPRCRQCRLDLSKAAPHPEAPADDANPAS